MKKILHYLYFVALVFLFFACRNERLSIDVSGIEADLDIVRLEQKLFEKDSVRFRNNMNELMASHYDFFETYTAYVLNIGPPDHPEFASHLHAFITDTVIARVADSVLYLFSDFSPWEKMLEEGFRHYAWYFPGKTLPQIYTCISGFNESIFTSGNSAAIGLDKYMGSDCIFYRYLGIPRYKTQKMYPRKMVSDLFFSLFITLFPYQEPVDHLLANMIYLGKALYFTEAMCPDLPDTLLTGFTGQQSEWCAANEEAMWTYLAEQRLLYDTERLTVQRYTGDAPFTSTFSDQSPGRTGVWLGWQIVRSFMNQHPEVSLQAMIEAYDAQTLLAQSGYNPD